MIVEDRTDAGCQFSPAHGSDHVVSSSSITKLFPDASLDKILRRPIALVTVAVVLTQCMSRRGRGSSDNRDFLIVCSRTRLLVGDANEAADRILSEIDALAPTIAARAAEAEAARRIPADILQMLRSAGIFRISVPLAHGGLELDFPAVARVLQALAKIDGSIGWISPVANVAAVVLPLLALRDLRRILSQRS
jgi:hypothetical protein